MNGHSIDVRAFEALGSTNTWLADNDVANGICVTDHQQAGQGRRGRVWDSLPGNLTFSIAATLPVELHTLSVLPLVTGIACAEALQSSTGVDVRVKWPNDLLVAESKLGGLLHESAPGESGVRVIGGIGINLVDDERLSALGIGGTSLAVSGIASSRRDELLVAIATAVLGAWQQFVEQGWVAFATRWERVDVLNTLPVRIVNGPPDAADSDTRDGVACGLDTNGALLVRLVSGELISVHAGDVSVRPRW